MPLRVWYLLGGRLPLRHREWVFRQATKPTWLAWFTVRAFLQPPDDEVRLPGGRGGGRAQGADAAGPGALRAGVAFGWVVHVECTVTL